MKQKNDGDDEAQGTDETFLNASVCCRDPCTLSLTLPIVSSTVFLLPVVGVSVLTVLSCS